MFSQCCHRWRVREPIVGLTARTAAVAAAQYVHIKKGDGGKKDEDAEKAKKAGSGKFAPSAPPKLVVNNRK